MGEGDGLTIGSTARITDREPDRSVPASKPRFGAGGPMMFGIGPATRIYLAAGSTDMRKSGIDLEQTSRRAWHRVTRAAE